MLAEHRDGPEVAVCPELPSVADCAPRAAPGVNEKFRARAEPSPSSRSGGPSSPLSGTKLPCEVQKAVSAADRHEDGDPAQPAIPQGLGRLRVAVHRSTAFSC